MNSRPHCRRIAQLTQYLVACVAIGRVAAAHGSPPAARESLAPLRAVSRLTEHRAMSLELDRSAFADLKQGHSLRKLTLPLPDGSSLALDVSAFNVIRPGAKFMLADRNGSTPLPPPDNVYFRGHIAGDPLSHAFLAVSVSGIVNGYVRTSTGNYIIATQPDGARTITIYDSSIATGLPEFPDFCGVGAPAHPVAEVPGNRGSPGDNRGMLAANVAIDADSQYLALFPGGVVEAEEYIAQLLAAVSDIYERDFNLRLNLAFARIWSGGEPFGADDVSGFRDYWQLNENMDGLHYVHLFSGRRDLAYGGIAFVGGTCTQEAFGVSGFLLGGFPSPLGPSSLGNWDVIVVAHEMGHNSGTYHTHDGYTPTIDDCGNGIPSRGTIMGYCHIHPGGTSNTDLYMHRRVEDLVESGFAAGNCFYHDCNDNGVDDALDIAFAVSADLNGDAIPDECQDCNSNGILDPIEIAGGAPDVNGNLIPDACEPDCNGNGLPDPYECDLNPANDLDGDNVPDDCEPDCNSNGIVDWIDTSTGGVIDVDRNAVPDACEDCNANGITDWKELGRTNNLFVADRSNIVREYYSTSGYPVQNLGAGLVQDPADCVFGPDRQLYVASFANDRIVKIDVDSGVASILVPAGGGGLDGPVALAFGSDGNLYVASQLTSRIIRYNPQTGASAGSFVTPQPSGLVFGPNGVLFVATTDNRVLRYGPVTGTLLSTFVAAGSGGLSLPRGMAFLPNGNLLVASNNSGNILEYQSGNGAFVRVFNQVWVVDGAWGLRVGPNGNVFAVRNINTIRVLEFRLDGTLVRSYVRGDFGLPSPTGLAFRPGATNDCNANRRVDACDPQWTDVGLFVQTLLSAPPDPTLACFYNRNGDAVLDARDIQPFVADLLAP